MYLFTPQPLQEELVATSKEVMEASQQVQELREAVQSAQDLTKETQGIADVEEAVGVVPNSMNTAVLVDLEQDAAAKLSDDDSLTLPPSLDMLTGSINMLVPEKIPDQQLQDSHKLQDSNQQLQSQELF